METEPRRAILRAVPQADPCGKIADKSGKASSPNSETSRLAASKFLALLEGQAKMIAARAVSIVKAVTINNKSDSCENAAGAAGTSLA